MPSFFQNLLFTETDILPIKKIPLSQQYFFAGTRAINSCGATRLNAVSAFTQRILSYAVFDNGGTYSGLHTVNSAHPREPIHPRLYVSPSQHRRLSETKRSRITYSPSSVFYHYNIPLFFVNPSQILFPQKKACLEELGTLFGGKSEKTIRCLIYSMFVDSTISQLFQKSKTFL